MSRIEARGSVLAEALPDPAEIAPLSSVAPREAAAMCLEPIEGGAARRAPVGRGRR